MENPKHHHFVPRWYLEKFTNPNTGFLHVYDKITKLWRKQKPNKLMKINRFYEQKHAPEGADTYILEKFLGSYLEPKAKDAFETLIYQRRDLTVEDTAAMLAYMELQRIRVPRQAETAKQLLMNCVNTILLNDLPPELVSAVRSKKVVITVEDSFRFNFMRTLTGFLGPYFARMTWTMVKAEEGYGFVTSDSPVTFFNGDFIPPFEPGIGLAGTMVFFPLDSQHLLWLRHQELIDQPNINRSAIIPESKIKDGTISISQIEWDGEQVCRHNCTMLILSHRIIVGANKDIIEKAVNFYA